MTETTNPASQLRERIDTAIRGAVRPWYLSNAVRGRASDAVLDVVSAEVVAAAARGREVAEQEMRRRETKTQETALRLAREQGRAEALNEAATMLARGGHRSAVTKVRDMAAVPHEAAETTP